MLKRAFVGPSIRADRAGHGVQDSINSSMAHRQRHGVASLEYDAEMMGVETYGFEGGSSIPMSVYTPRGAKVYDRSQSPADSTAVHRGAVGDCTDPGDEPTHREPPAVCRALQRMLAVGHPASQAHITI